MRGAGLLFLVLLLTPLAAIAARAERKLARLGWACPPRRASARTNPLHITVRYGKLTPPGETEAGNPGEEPTAPTGTFRSAERRAKR